MLIRITGRAEDSHSGNISDTVTEMLSLNYPALSVNILGNTDSVKYALGI